MALDGHDYKRNRASIDRMMVCGKIFTDFYREYDLATFQSYSFLNIEVDMNEKLQM